MILAFAVGILPTLPSLGLELHSQALGLGMFAITIAICVAGFRTGCFALLWVAWGAASTISLIALGFSTPLGLLAILPAMAPVHG